MEVTSHPPCPSNTIRPIPANGTGGDTGWFGPVATSQPSDELYP
jgi:hypothetical protein